MNIDLENTVQVSISKLMSESFSAENIEDCQGEVHGDFVFLSYTKKGMQFILSLRKLQDGTLVLKVCEIGVSVSEIEVIVQFKRDIERHLVDHNFAKLFFLENIN